MTDVTGAGEKASSVRLPPSPSSPYMVFSVIRCSSYSGALVLLPMTHKPQPNPAPPRWDAIQVGGVKALQAGGGRRKLSPPAPARRGTTSRAAGPTLSERLMDASASWLLQHHNTDHSPFVRWAGQGGIDMSLLASMVGQTEAGGSGDLMQVDTPSVVPPHSASASCSVQQPAQTRSAARAARHAAMQAAASAAIAASSGAARAAGPAGQSCAAMAPGSGAAADAGDGGTLIEDAEMGSRRAAREPAEAPLRKLSISLIDTYKMINQVRGARVAGWPAAARRWQGRPRVALDQHARGPAGVAGSLGRHGSARCGVVIFEGRHARSDGDRSRSRRCCHMAFS
jgi:hypothetical protein